VKEGAASILSSLNVKWKNFYDDWGLSWYTYMPFQHEHDVDPRTWPCMSYANGTVSSHHVVVALDTFALVRPFLPIYNKNTLDGGDWPFEDEKFLRHSPLPFAAGTLEKIAAELYLGAERLVDWNYNTFLSFRMNAPVSCCIGMNMIVL
jgi:hypothetical protein